MEEDKHQSEATTPARTASTLQEAGRIVCSGSIAWVDGEEYLCERGDEHDGEKLMHGAVVAGEWTNWTDSYLRTYPEFAPSDLPVDGS